MIKSLFFSLFLVVCFSGCGDIGTNTTVSSSVDPVASPTPVEATTSTTIEIPANVMGMGSAAFGQYPLTITVGSSVTWVNNYSQTIEITADQGAFDSSWVIPGASYTYIFLYPDTYDYYGDIYGYDSNDSNMFGQIVVQ